MHAVEFLRAAPDAIPPVVVLWGGQRHFKHAVLGILRKQIIDDDDNSLTLFNGADAQLSTVSDELHTVSMWGDRRLVVVDDADAFVTTYRAGIEKLVEKPAKKSVLVLDVGAFLKTTRLYKQIQAKGLEIECAELKGTQLVKWLQESTKETYGQSLTRDAAALLVELVGAEMGMLDTELAKLASYVGSKGKIEIGDVKSLVGGWRTETTWAMNDAARDEDLNFALNALDQLLTAGEPAIKLLGGIGYTFRKFSLAAELSRSGSLDAALRQAGVFPAGMAPGETYLRRMGRARAELILKHLVDTDAGIKGANRLSERMQLEQLLISLSGKRL